jgi:ABC-type lipoprotein release transport system permease subunit
VTWRAPALRLPADSARTAARAAEARVRAVAGVRGVRGRVSTRGVLLVRGRSENVQVKGVRFADEPALRAALLLSAGALPGSALAGSALPDGAIAVSEAVARALHADAGTPCVLVAPTHAGSVNVTDCTVAAIYRTASRATGNWIYMDRDAAALLYDVAIPTEMLVDVERLDDASAVGAAVGAALRPERARDWASVADYRERAGLAGSIARANGTYMVGLVGCVVLFAALGLATAVVNNVRDREQELGTLLALGFRGRDLVTLVIAETAGLSAPAALAGALLGATGALAAAHVGIDVGDAAAVAFGLRLLRPSVSPAAVIAAAGACAALPVLFAWHPARRAARLQPVDALRAA